ncbi:MAG: FlgD immunoglobulin-like domain containing protein [Candidatus Zixiibacteriota bacterium]
MNNIVTSGREVSTAVYDDADLLPRAFLTTQNFPNPFNSSTVIEHNLPATSAVDVDIYNELGQTAESYRLPTQLPGKHSIEWKASSHDGRALPSGAYFYKIKSKTAEVSGKMLLLK